MPYAVLQGYSVVILFLLARLQPSRYTRGNDIYWVFAGYVLAKLLETFDRQLFGLGHVASGHSLKHLAAAIAGLVVCRMLCLRRLQSRSLAVHSFPALLLLSHVTLEEEIDECPNYGDGSKVPDFIPARREGSFDDVSSELEGQPGNQPARKLNVTAMEMLTSRRRVDHRAQAADEGLDRPEGNDQQRHDMDDHDHIEGDESQPILHQVLLCRSGLPERCAMGGQWFGPRRRRLSASSPIHGVSSQRCRTDPAGRRLRLPART